MWSGETIGQTDHDVTQLNQAWQDAHGEAENRHHWVKSDAIVIKPHDIKEIMFKDTQHPISSAQLNLKLA
jgi:hypothetical protein